MSSSKKGCSAVVVLTMLLLTLSFASPLHAEQTTTTHDFDSTTINALLTDSFRSGDDTNNYTYEVEGGLGGSDALGSVSIPNVWTARQAYSVPITDETIIVSGYFENTGNSGYGSLGFSAKKTNGLFIDYPNTSQGLGVIFHGSSGDFISNGESIEELSWVGGNITTGWWFMTLEITGNGDGTYDMNFEIYPSDADGVLGEIKTSHTISNIPNEPFNNANAIRGYFGTSLDRFATIDDVSIQGTHISEPVIVVPFLGAGTEIDPYQISSCALLQDIGMEYDFMEAHYIVTENIDCSMTNPSDDGFDVEGRWADEKGFDPIGDYGNFFSGHFDGNDKTIDGLFIDRADDEYSENEGDEAYVGLFATVNGATIEDLELTNAMVKGHEAVGGIAGLALLSTLEDLRVNVDVADNDCDPGYCIWARYGQYGGGIVGDAEQDTLINRVQTGGPVKGSGNSIGGIVGLMVESTLTNATSTSHIDGGYDLGGIVGIAAASNIENAHAYGNVLVVEEVLSGKIGNRGGGLVGSAVEGTTILQSSAHGNVEGLDDIGGFVGSSEDAYIGNSFATGDVSGSYQIGGFAGLNTGVVINTYATGNVEGLEYVGGLVGSNVGSTYFSYATGNVTGEAVLGGFAGYNGADSIHSSFSTGYVSSEFEESIGGFIGYNNGFSYENSGWWVSAGPSYAIGYDSDIEGGISDIEYNYFSAGSFRNENDAIFTTEIAVYEEEMESWDFEEVWTTRGGTTYPQFQWQEYDEPQEQEEFEEVEIPENIAYDMLRQIIGDEDIYWTSVGVSSDSTIFSASGFTTSGESSYGVIYRSIDGGENWSEVFALEDTLMLSIVTSADGEKISALALNFDGSPELSYFIVSSVDGGETWDIGDYFDLGEEILSFEFGPLFLLSRLAASSDLSSMYASVFNKILYSSDGGNTWNEVMDFGGVPVLPVSIDASADGARAVIAAVPVFTDEIDELILYSSDYGANWNPVWSDNDNSIFSTAISPDGSHIFITDFFGELRVSDDEGDTWATSENPDEYSWLYVTSSPTGDYIIASASNYYYVGEDEGYTIAIYLSRDGGETWERISEIEGSEGDVFENFSGEISGGYDLSKIGLVAFTELFVVTQSEEIELPEEEVVEEVRRSRSGSRRRVAQNQAQTQVLNQGTAPVQQVVSVTSPLRNLTVGNTGDDILALQKLLNANGFVLASSGAGSLGNETTTFGGLTRAALARYQAANGIAPAVGYFGPLTRAQMKTAGLSGVWW